MARAAVRRLALRRGVAASATFFAAVVLSIPQVVNAANKTVYRCNVQGRVLYSDEPCGAQSKEVNVDDTRTPEQRSEAREAARREAAMGKQMRRERLEDEKAARATARPSNARPSSQASVEYSNKGGKIKKTVKPRHAAKHRTDIDESMPIYIDVPKGKETATPIKR